jgi:hypothetical protein
MYGGAPEPLIIEAYDSHSPLYGYTSHAYQINILPPLTISRKITDKGCGWFTCNASLTKGKPTIK